MFLGHLLFLAPFIHLQQWNEVFVNGEMELYLNPLSPIKFPLTTLLNELMLVWCGSTLKMGSGENH